MAFPGITLTTVIHGGPLTASETKFKLCAVSYDLHWDMQYHAQ